MGLLFAIVVMQRQLHQTIEQVHDCHHCEHLLPMMLLGEWLKTQMGLFAHDQLCAI